MANYNNDLQELCIHFPGCKPNGCLHFGMGIASTVGKELSEITKKKILIITDSTIINLNLHSSIVQSLKEHSLKYDIFHNVQSEPHIETMEQLEKFLFTDNYGAIIGLGGGSVLDVAKVAAVMAYMKCSAVEIFANQDIICGSLTTILIPTTSGTGSEVSPYSVMAIGNKKRFISSTHLYADIALVDPELTFSMPQKVTATTGLDALTHGVEGGIGKDNPYTRAMMLQCVKLTFKYLPRAFKDGSDREARYYMSLASVLGMLAYTQGGGLYAHSISYILTTNYKCPHGLGCGLALPYILQMNKPYITDLLHDISKVISPDNKVFTEEQVIEQFMELVNTVGVPTGLADIGINENELDGFAEVLVNQYYRALNPVKLTVDSAKTLMYAMYKKTLKFVIN